DGLEARLFFIKMAKEELKHARTLLEMAPRAKDDDFDLAVSAGDLEAMERVLAESLRTVPRAKGLDGIFTAICRMEQGELNSIYESVLHYYTNQLLPRGGVEVFLQSTEVHIAMLREAGEKFGLSGKTKGELETLRVKEVNYYKNIK
ncbi:MAG TPA: hypothetical protein DDW31_05655, partial [candidate division Zixibacteria bacterium]|nr:hypothetical protein [candidate division Zixibacteria bacterium]